MVIVRGQLQKYLYDPDQDKVPISPEEWKKAEEEERLGKLRNQRWDCMMMQKNYRAILSTSGIIPIFKQREENAITWKNGKVLLQILTSKNINIHQKKIMIDILPRLGVFDFKGKMLMVLLSAN